MISNRGDAIEYLDSLIGSGIRPGLERMRGMLAASGHPERSVPAVLVAGTNGKGSTAATLSAIATAAGYRAGLYTSPHLLSLEERWRIGERTVDEESFVEAVRRLRGVAEKAEIVPTYFEALTLLAFFIFEESECEIAILEVGMGGRLDATNVADPVLSVITAIDFDHQEWLGNTIDEITREKLGITRTGVAALVAPQSPEAEEAIRRRADEIGCVLHEVASEVEVVRFETRRRGTRATLRTPKAQYEIDSPLAGDHQAHNLATSVRAAELLSLALPAIGRESITRGCASVRWRGRLETFDADGRMVLVDGAHNPAGARSASRFIERFVPGPRRLVFGVLDDKDAEAMLAPLVPLFDEVMLTTPDSERGRAPESLVEIVGRHGSIPLRVVARDDEAIREALSQPDRWAVVICGSLYLAGSAVRVLDQIVMPSRREAGSSR